MDVQIYQCKHLFILILYSDQFLVSFKHVLL